MSDPSMENSPELPPKPSGPNRRKKRKLEKGLKKAAARAKLREEAATKRLSIKTKRRIDKKLARNARRANRVK